MAHEELFKIVSVLDPAIDTERMTPAEMIAYRDNRRFEDIAKFIKPGQAPTIFHTREVPHALWEPFVMMGVNEHDRYSRAFRAGVMHVENLYSADGTFLPSTELPREHDALKDESMARFSPAERAEIGMVIWARSFLARRIARTYQLPLTVHECLVAREFRPAESNPSLQPQGSSEASSPKAETPAASPATDTAPSSSASSSATPTAATATATAEGCA